MVIYKQNNSKQGYFSYLSQPLILEDQISSRIGGQLSGDYI